MVFKSLCCTDHGSAKQGTNRKFINRDKRLAINYQEINKQLSRVQMVQVKAKGTFALIEMAKIDHIWAKFKSAQYFSSLEIRAGYHHISIHLDSRPKTAFICPYGKFQWKKC